MWEIRLGIMNDPPLLAALVDLVYLSVANQNIIKVKDR